jgi:Tfp pilus assembly protein PilW
VANPRFDFRLRTLRPEQGLTLVELLVGFLISGVLFAAATDLLINHIRTSESTVWGIQLERSLSKLTNLMAAEASEACAMGTTSNPSTCTPAAACLTTSSTEVRMMVPVLTAGTITNEWIRYFRDSSTNQLLRDGPRILPSGALDIVNADQSNVLVMERVTAFTVTPGDDCRSATLQVTVNSANTSYTRTQEIGLRAGVNQFEF